MVSSRSRPRVSMRSPSSSARTGSVACDSEGTMRSSLIVSLADRGRNLSLELGGVRGTRQSASTAGDATRGALGGCRARCGRGMLRAPDSATVEEAVASSYEKGLEVRKAVLGAEHVENSIRNADDFSKPLQE